MSEILGQKDRDFRVTNNFTRHQLASDRKRLKAFLKDYWEWQRLSEFEVGKIDEAMEIFIDIKDYIRQLPQDQKKYLFLNQIAGFTEREIGWDLGVPFQVINRTINKALETIQVRLDASR